MLVPGRGFISFCEETASWASRLEVGHVVPVRREHEEVRREQHWQRRERGEQPREQELSSLALAVLVVAEAVVAVVPGRLH